MTSPGPVVLGPKPQRVRFNVKLCLCSSGRFFSIILKMEEMLHSWFPHIEATLPQTHDGAAAKKPKVSNAAKL